MAIKAHSMATKIDTEAGTITFSMLNRNDIAVVEHTMEIDIALGIFTFLLSVLDDEDDDDLDDETEVVGHC